MAKIGQFMTPGALHRAGVRGALERLAGDEKPGETSEAVVFLTGALERFPLTLWRVAI
jgi:hypothetical protein